MNRLDFATWIKTISLQSALNESNKHDAYDLVPWLTEGKLVPVDASNFKASTYEELVEAGILTK